MDAVAILERETSGEREGRSRGSAEIESNGTAVKDRIESNEREKWLRLFSLQLDSTFNSSLNSRAHSLHG